MIDHLLALIQRAVYLIDTALLLALVCLGRKKIPKRELAALRPLALALGIVGAWGVVSYALIGSGGPEEPMMRVLFHAAAPVIVAWGVFGSNRRIAGDLFGGATIAGILLSEFVTVRGWTTSPEELAGTLAVLWIGWAVVAFVGLLFRRRGPVRQHERLAALLVASMPPTALGFIAWGVHPAGYVIAQVIGVFFASGIAIMTGGALWKLRSGSWGFWPRQRS